MTKSVVSCLRQPIVLRSDHRSRTTPCHSSRARFMNRLQSWLYSVWRQQSECLNDSKVYSDFVRPWWSCLTLHWDLPQTKKTSKASFWKRKVLWISIQLCLQGTCLHLQEAHPPHLIAPRDVVLQLGPKSLQCQTDTAGAKHCPELRIRRQGNDQAPKRAALSRKNSNFCSFWADLELLKIGCENLVVKLQLTKGQDGRNGPWRQLKPQRLKGLNSVAPVLHVLHMLHVPLASQQSSELEHRLKLRGNFTVLHGSSSDQKVLSIKRHGDVCLQIWDRPMLEIWNVAQNFSPNYAHISQWPLPNPLKGYWKRFQFLWSCSMKWNSILEPLSSQRIFIKSTIPVNEQMK